MDQRKVVIITGASRGVGAATACWMGKNSATVVLVARSRNRLDEVAHKVETLGGTALVIPADVSNPAACQNIVDTTLEHYKEIHALINNAGIILGTGGRNRRTGSTAGRHRTCGYRTVAICHPGESPGSFLPDPVCPAISHQHARPHHQCQQRCFPYADSFRQCLLRLQGCIDTFQPRPGGRSLRRHIDFRQTRGGGHTHADPDPSRRFGCHEPQAVHLLCGSESKEPAGTAGNSGPLHCLAGFACPSRHEWRVSKLQ